MSPISHMKRGFFDCPHPIYCFRKTFVSRIPPLGRSGSNESKHSSEAKIASLFEKYRDKDFNNQEDAILTLGVEALCKDLELRPDEFRVLLLAWKCNAEQVIQNLSFKICFVHLAYYMLPPCRFLYKDKT